LSRKSKASDDDEDDEDDEDDDNYDDEYFRVLMAHRLEFRPWDKITFAVSEDVMYKDTSFDPQVFNPSFIYHNLNSRSKFNAIAHVELSYTFLPGWNIYGQFVLDQAVAPNEDADAESTAWGALVGFDYARILGSGVLTTSLEGAMTLPCLYLRDKVDFLMATRYASLHYWQLQKFDYIGFPYGGDAVVVKWDNTYRVPEKWETEFATTLALHGPVSMYRYDNDDEIVKYGTQLFKGGSIDASLTATLNGSIQLPVPKWMTSWKCYGETSYIQRVHYDADSDVFSDWEDDLQLTVGTTISL
jgi:hypothetical protein